MEGGSLLKTWEPHRADWMPGDPVWRDTLGKGLIGAVNYLASKGQNAISFLTMNIDGDGRNVWPYIAADAFDRFDCSKLDQWEIIFEHCDRRGLYLHFKTQKEENDHLLDGDELGRIRKLYYRELIVRFAHHLALNWNLGEENTNTVAQRRAFAQYFRDIDPYDHHIVIHTFPGADELVYGMLIGDQSELTGASLQAEWTTTHARTLKWVERTRDTGKPWVVANDEQAPAFIGVPNDEFVGAPSQDDIRKVVLWGNLMAGGAGVEYFFGYALPHNDLTCEDFRSRDRMWDYNRIATQFFHTYLPWWRMQNADSLITGAQGSAYCFEIPDSLYVLYLPEGPEVFIELGDATGEYEVLWFDPRNGGELQAGTISILPGGNIRDIGMPPSDLTSDWVALVRKTSDTPEVPVLDWGPVSCTRAALYWKYTSVAHVSVQFSTDGITFDHIPGGQQIHCGIYCFIQVVLPVAVTWYRLEIGAGQYSNTIQCQRPCAADMPDTGGVMREKAERGE